MKLRKSFAIVFCALFSLAANAVERDEFFWLGEMNKATAVINSEEGLLDKAVTPKIARGIEEVITNGSKPGAKRPKKVIAFEPLLIKAAGMDVPGVDVAAGEKLALGSWDVQIIREK